ncbi:MAG: Tad domain-containing protein [Burkholderiales bacterium]|jgi:hypothetical protein|nr:Tad domain-containing protein [Burkholderiales bacterium]
MLNRVPVKQRGAVLPLVGLTLFVLLGFGGLVIDAGGMFVAKTELQSALDSCSLAAAQELDGAPDALTRATNAGRTAGNANKVQYQAASAGITDADVNFNDVLPGIYSKTIPPSSARYAKCTHKIDGITNYLIQMVGGSTTNSVGAVAVATRSHAQSTCPIPVGLRSRPGGTSPNYGYLTGEWVAMLYDPTKTDPSEMGWYNLDGSTSASETKKEMAGTGYCGTRIGDTLGTPGAKVSLDDEWNARFGIYKNNGDAATSGMRPDYSGYAYTSTNWKNAVPQNAFAGTPAVGSALTAANFKLKRQAYASYGDTTTVVKDGDNMTGLNMKGGYKDLASPGVGGQHQSLGESKRIVLVPILSAASQVIDYACMLMLQPISGPTTTIQLEFLGNAGNSSSPCSTNGLVGGTAGPLVPALVQ